MELTISYLIKKVSKKKIIDNKQWYIDFIHDKLGKFKDDKDSIGECLSYYCDSDDSGSVYEALNEDQKTMAIVVILNTKMKKFLPSNFLVYIVVDEAFRGQGLGGALIDHAQEQLEGSICLHVEPDNPALRLYERKGFTNKYLEMRYNP